MSDQALLSDSDDSDDNSDKEGDGGDSSDKEDDGSDSSDEEEDSSDEADSKNSDTDEEELLKPKVEQSKSAEVNSSFYQWWFFSYLTDFSYFSVNKKFPKIAGHSQNMLKIERSYRWFQLFFIDLQLFYFLFRIIPDKDKIIQKFWKICLDVDSL